MRLDLSPLGVAWFDRNLGGLPVREPTVVLGPPKSGKTCLSLGFLLHHLDHEGAGALLVTDDAADAIVDLAGSFLERDLRSLIRSKRLTVLSYGPSFVHELQSSGGAGAPLAEIASLVKRRGVSALAFDTFDPVLLAPDGASARPFVRGVVTGLAPLAVPTILTARFDGKVRSPALQELVARSAAAIELALDRKGRKLRIEHASWCNLENIEMRVDFVQRQGLVVREETVVLPQSSSGEHRFEGLLTYDSLPAVRKERDIDSDVTQELERVSVRELAPEPRAPAHFENEDFLRRDGGINPFAEPVRPKSEPPRRMPSEPPQRTGGSLYPHPLPPGVSVPLRPALPGFKRPELTDLEAPPAREGRKGR